MLGNVSLRTEEVLAARPRFPIAMDVFHCMHSAMNSMAAPVGRRLTDPMGESRGFHQAPGQ
ncbi:hypothetical protein GCM10017784_36150 [Deinococcus indicus]|nr:hypothetical protein GCM10017784_36150 [Deinococcus indicus]